MSPVRLILPHTTLSTEHMPTSKIVFSVCLVPSRDGILGGNNENNYIELFMTRIPINNHHWFIREVHESWERNQRQYSCLTLPHYTKIHLWFPSQASWTFLINQYWPLEGMARGQVGTFTFIQPHAMSSIEHMATGQVGSSTCLVCSCDNIMGIMRKSN